MNWQYTPYVLPSLLAAIVSAALAYYAWRRRAVPGAAAFTWLMLAVAEYSLTYGLELASSRWVARLFWLKAQYTGIVSVPLAWLVFALDHSGQRKWLARHRLALLAVVPLATFLLACTNEAHGLIWRNIQWETGGSFPLLDLTYGTWLWVHVLYSYLLLMVGTFLLVQVSVRSSPLYRRQAGALLVGALLPWIGNALYVFKLNPFPNLDLTPFAFTFSGLAMAWALFRFRLLDLVPVAREAVVENMADGLIVLDTQGRVVDLNPAAIAIVDRPAAQLLGQPFDRAFSSQPNLLECCRGATEARAEIALGKGGTQRTYDLRLSPLHDRRGRLTGRLMLLHDVTEQVRAEAEITRLATVIEQAAVTVVITDPQGNIVYANPYFETSTGYSVAEALGQNPRILKSDRQDASFYRELWDTITAGRTWNGIFINKHRGGRLYHEEATIFPIRNASGEIINYAAVKRDVTERVRAEQALRESEEHYRMLFDLLPYGGEVLDTKGYIEDCSTSNAQLVGYKRDELIGMHITNLLDSASRQVFHEKFPLLATGDLVRAKICLLHKDGTPVHVFRTARPILDKEGLVSKILVLNVDITELVRAEEERERLLAQIHAQAKQMQQTIETVPEGVLLLDAEYQVMLANPAAERNLAALADAKVGDTLTRLGDRPLAELLTSPPAKGLWHEVKADGRTFEVIARPVGNGPESESWVLVIRDVTQEREIERRLRQQERLAAVGQLAAGIAHDFNNIMAVIVLYTQMGLSTPDIPAKLQKCLQTVSTQARRATDLIQQILDFSRRAVLEIRPMDLTPFLKEVVKMLERTVPESVEIGFTYGSDEYTVNADPTRMQQAIMNLALNARDAMPQGGKLRISLSRTAATGETRCEICGEIVAGEWVRIAVTDTGNGIPPDVLPHIFEPFFTTKEVGKGTGLGLAQVYGIVKQHEGHIDVSTKMGEGTTFIIYLPVLQVQKVEQPSVAVKDAPQGQGETVLVVEDNAEMREAFADILELLNYQVMIAANGRDALDILEKYGDKIVLVLSDLVMPVMGGKALFCALRQQYPEIKMIMLTGHPMEKELQDLRAEGLSGYMLKPPSVEQLAQKVAQALKGRSE